MTDSLMGLPIKETNDLPENKEGDIIFGGPLVEPLTEAERIERLKKTMREMSDGDIGEGYIWPPELQQEFLAQWQAGNPNGVYFKCTEFGLSIHNLYPEPVYSFKVKWLMSPLGYETLIILHNQEIDAGRWTDGS